MTLDIRTEKLCGYHEGFGFNTIITVIDWHHFFKCIAISSVLGIARFCSCLLYLFSETFSGCWSNCFGYSSKLSESMEEHKLSGRPGLDKDKVVSFFRLQT